MPRDARFPAGLSTPGPPYSPVVVAGDLVWTAGQVAPPPEGTATDVATQTDEVLRKVTSCLEAAGSTMDDVVKVTVFLADLGDFAAFNESYARHFAPPYPVRTTVQAGLAEGVLVEIDVVARGGGSG